MIAPLNGSLGALHIHGSQYDINYDCEQACAGVAARARRSPDSSSDRSTEADSRRATSASGPDRDRLCRARSGPALRASTLLQRIEVLRALIVRYPLGALVAISKDGITAHHIPMQLLPGFDGRWLLRGNVARANPLWQARPAGTEMLAIFRGAERRLLANGSRGFSSRSIRSGRTGAQSAISIDARGDIISATDFQGLSHVRLYYR
ncbi:MAG: FMN-binding negative transcriptional regulator [Steroidobacteraceae bacterium]